MIKFYQKHKEAKRERIRREQLRKMNAEVNRRIVKADTK
jgi:hypothetical protein